MTVLRSCFIERRSSGSRRDDLSERWLKKPLSGRAFLRSSASVISGLTACQGFDFSRFSQTAGIRMRELLKWSSQWWLGAIALLILWGFAAWTSTEPLEAEIAARANAAVKDAVLDKKRVSVAGRDVSVAAEAFSIDGSRAALAAVDAAPGVRLVNDETRLVPEAKPFVWSAERDVVRVTLAGSAPLPQVKGRLVEAAKATLGNVEVADQMTLSRGAPPRFDAAAMLLLDQIGKLKDGKITLSDDKVSLSGMARELGGREAIVAALKNLPEGFSVAANDVKAPAYVFQAYKDPVASTLTLTGNVPDKNVHAALVAAAERKFFEIGRAHV